MALRELFEAVAERHPIEPTSILDYPLKVSLLSKQKPDAPNFVERFGLTPAERKAAVFQNKAALPATDQLAALPMG
jgi:lysyl-tRNA synthetase class II